MWFGANRSIQLSYGRVASSYHEHVPVEIEIKLRLADGAAGARALLGQRGYTAAGPRLLESDQLFDREGELRQSDRILRLRSSGERWTLTYKGPAGRSPHKSREELEVDFSSGPSLVSILEALGYQPSFRYEKFRTKFTAPGEPGIVTIDETPIGDFLELEGPAYWIDETAVRLGYSTTDYLTVSYASLYREYCAQ